MSNKIEIVGIIPSRYGSTRFEGKPLIDIGGKTMIERVYLQAKRANLLSQVIVATDDERIFNAVKQFGGEVVMTKAEHLNGTERCAEVAQNINADFIINIQGDEPFIQPEQIDLLAFTFIENQNIQIATLIKKQEFSAALQNPARIKVAINKNKEALYFSRSVIPFNRSGVENETIYYKHLGIYGYAKNVLLDIVKLTPTPLEISESLEQLRWLENGYKIACSETFHESISIDTPEDLKEALAQFL